MAKVDADKRVTRGMLDEAVDAILQGMGKMFAAQDKRFDKIESRLSGVESRLDGVETELSYVKDTVKGLKADFFDTPSRREFSELKARVDEYHPLS